MRSRNQPSKRTQLRVTRVFFLSLLSRNFDDQLGLIFHSYFMHLLRDTKCEDWSLTTTSSVHCLKSELYSLVQKDLKIYHPPTRYNLSPLRNVPAAYLGVGRSGKLSQMFFSASRTAHLSQGVESGFIPPATKILPSRGNKIITRHLQISFLSIIEALHGVGK